MPLRRLGLAWKKLFFAFLKPSGRTTDGDFAAMNLNVLRSRAQMSPPAGASLTDRIQALETGYDNLHREVGRLMQENRSEHDELRDLINEERRERSASVTAVRDEQKELT